MSFQPKVSIVIPVYNGANYMREAINSALAQSYPNCEVIVVNDGSRDNGKTLEIARSYGDRVRVVDKPNGGVATALNAGIAAMTGEYFSWLSHDDVYPPDKVARQIEFLAALPDKNTVLFGDYTIINEKSEFIGSVATSSVDTPNMLFELFSSQNIHGCTLLVPRSVFDKVGNFRNDLPTTQDYDLWLRVAQHFPFAYVPGIFTHSRQHAEQGSRTLTHIREVRDFYLTNFALISPGWLDAHYASAQLPEIYMRLLKKFSAPGLNPVFLRVLAQARSHLAFKSAHNDVWFSLRAFSLHGVGLIKGTIKRMIPLPVKNFLRRSLNQQTHADQVPAKLDFSRIYKNNIFGSKESRSGSGSTMEQTKYIREVLPELLRELNVKTMLDVPCGDFNWMRHVDLSGIHYIGGDIVEDLVQKDTQEFASADREFRMLNIITDDLPKVDLILCRDCLVHMSFADGQKAIENFKRSGATYLLTTTFTDRPVNQDLYGIWRTLNLQIAPYNLPTPQKIINEKCTEGRNKFTDKSLGLWMLKDL